MKIYKHKCGMYCVGKETYTYTNTSQNNSTCNNAHFNTLKSKYSDF